MEGTADDFDRWLAAARDGDREAMFEVGKALAQTDVDAAAEWYGRAAEAGEMRAMDNLGSLLERQGNRTGAEAWYRRAIEAGSVKSMNRLGLMLEETDPEEAERLFAGAADLGGRWAMVRMAQILLRRGSIEEAVLWLERLAGLGDCWAMKNLAALAFDRDPDAAARWWHRAADEGDAVAMRFLGQHARSRGDDRAAKTWFEKGAEGDDGLSALYRGAFSPAGSDERRRWLEMAADLGGSAEPKAQLGSLLLDREPAKAWNYIEQAAAEGHPWAAGMLVWRFMRRHPLAGRKSSPLREELMRLLRAAAEAGDARSGSTLGNLLASEGRDDEARTWLERGADEGSETARFGLQVLDIPDDEWPEILPIARGGFRALRESLPRPHLRRR